MNDHGECACSACRYVGRLGVGSRRSMRAALDRFVAALGAEDSAEVQWHELTADDVAAATRALVDLYAPRSAAQSAAALRGVLRLVAESRPGFEPSRLIAAIVRARGSREPAGRAPTTDEISALFEAASRTATPERDSAALALLYGAGLRRAEAAACVWADVVGDPPRAVQVIGKGNRGRSVPLPPGSVVALAHWCARSLEIAGDKHTPRIQTTRSKASVLGLSPEGVYALILRLKRDAAIVEHLRPHDLRRGYASDSLDSSGGDLGAVQRNMGHASPTTTALYDRRGERAAIRAATSLHVPYVPPSKA